MLGLFLLSDQFRQKINKAKRGKTNLKLLALWREFGDMFFVFLSILG